MKQIKLLLLSCILSASANAQVLWPFNPLLDHLKEHPLKDMSYDYKVVLENINTKQSVDSMTGRLNFSGNKFVDSNKFYFVERTADQYCKLDHIDKTVRIIELKALAKKLKTTLADEPNKITLVTDEFMASGGENIEYDISNPTFIRLKLHPVGQLIHYAYIDFRKSDYSFCGAYYELEDVDPLNNSHYRRCYYISNVFTKVNPASFNLSGIFAFKKGKPVLNAKYAQYKLVKTI